MAGIKEIREKSKGLLEQMAERRARGDQPIGKPAPETPMEARTAPGRMFGLQEMIFQAEERARKAEEALENLKTSTGDSAVLQAAEADVFQTEEVLQAAEAALQEAMKSQPARMARLADLHEIPNRRRKLSAQQYAELRENLKNNPLTNPVTVRIREAGGYEIVAGHNRVTCYRDLGREEVPINVLHLDDDETERAAFYSNLLAPSLPDYEKYIGFKSRMANKGFTQAQLAAEAGVTQPYISTVMAFGELPPEALLYVAEAPELFGTRVIPKLVRLAKQGKANVVTEAIRKIATEGISQVAALQFAEGAALAASKRTAPLTVRQGKAKFCEIFRTDKSVRLSFASAAEAEAAMAPLQKILEDQAAATKETLESSDFVDPKPSEGDINSL